MYALTIAPDIIDSFSVYLPAEADCDVAHCDRSADVPTESPSLMDSLRVSHNNGCRHSILAQAERQGCSLSNVLGVDHCLAVQRVRPEQDSQA